MVLIAPESQCSGIRGFGDVSPSLGRTLDRVSGTIGDTPIGERAAASAASMARTPGLL